jgi:21S rRNA (GM2251-2'-O)-methyltransferase
MAASSLSAASACARCWIRGPQWQSKSFIRNVSRTSAINRGINASQRSSTLRERERSSTPSGFSKSNRDSPSGRSNDRYGAKSAFQRKPEGYPTAGADERPSGRSVGRGGRSSGRPETRRDQRRSDRKDGGNDAKGSDFNDAFSKDMSDRKPSSFASGGRDRTRGFEKSARPSRDGDRAPSDSSGRTPWAGKDSDKPTGPAYDKKSRFDNEGVRAYGDNTGFFSKGTRSKRPGDKPAGGFGDRSARPARDSTGSFDRPSRPARDGDRSSSGSFDRSARPTRDGDRNPSGAFERSARPARDGDKNLSGSFDRSARPVRDGDRSSPSSFDRSARPTRDGDRASPSSFDRNARPSRDGHRDSFDIDARPARDGDRPSAGSFDRDARPARDGDRNSFDKKPFKSDRVQHDDVPVAIPYSSAASQWLYGVNTVVAALRGKRRQLYQLIVKKGERSSDADQILRLANSAGITIQTHDDTRLLDKLSEGRPHNGAVLETSALPVQPTIQLGKPDAETNTIPLELQRQNAEEIAVNGKSTTVQYDSKSWRQPIILFLDGITDPGNVGGILRTAHFYGVDAVAVATNTCCNLNSPVLAKASAGACEAIPILAVSKPADFIAKSAQAGWKICAAVAPDVRAQKTRKQLTAASLASKSPLADKPCILMMGSEGEGLRENLRSKADLEVTIARGASGRHIIDVGVDSVNVGVATGVLVDAFMRKPWTSAPDAPSDGSNRVF